MAEQETKEKPYERRCSEVIDEEFENACFPRGNEQLELALRQIKVRLAADMEDLRDESQPKRAYDHTDFYDF